MNSVQLIGRLTKDPDVRYSGEAAIARFTVAINRQKTRNNSDPGADFPNIVCFGKTAENVEKYVGKGRLVGITGRIQTGSYEGKDGKMVYTTEVVADRVEFLDRAGEAEPTQPRTAENKSKNLKPADDDFAQQEIYAGFSKLAADDIPF